MKNQSTDSSGLSAEKASTAGWIFHGLGWVLAAGTGGLALFEYWTLSHVPGFFGQYLFPFIWLGAFVLARKRILPAPWAAAVAGAMMVVLTVIDPFLYVYRASWKDAGDRKHEALEVLVTRQELTELGMNPFLAGAFYAPGDGERNNLYLYAGVPWRSFFGGTTQIVGKDIEDSQAQWRRGHGMPLSDAKWIPLRGQILAAAKNPPAVITLDTKNFAIRNYFEWRWGGMPALLDVSEDGRTAWVIPEGEGPVARVDLASFEFTRLHNFSDELRKLKAEVPPSGFSPHALSPAINGKRYLTLWQDTPLLVELDDGLVPLRVLNTGTGTPLKSILHVFRLMGLAFNPENGHLWVADSFFGRDGRIIEVDPTELKIVGSQPALPGVRDLLYDPLRRRLYAAEAISGRLVVYRVAENGSLEEKTRLHLGRWLRVLQWENGRQAHILVGSSAGIFRINPNRL